MLAYPGLVHLDLPWPGKAMLAGPGCAIVWRLREVSKLVERSDRRVQFTRVQRDLGLADRVANQRLAATARAIGGTVAIPADPGIDVMAGLPPTEDQIAAADVLRASDQSAKAIFVASLAQAVSGQKFSAIITEFPRDLRGFPADLPIYYYECPQAPLDGVLSVPFSANAKALPVSVWLPIGRGPSCAAVARTLES